MRAFRRASFCLLAATAVVIPVLAVGAPPAVADLVGDVGVDIGPPPVYVGMPGVETAPKSTPGPKPKPQANSALETPCSLVCDFNVSVSRNPTLSYVGAPETEAQSKLATGVMTEGAVGTADLSNPPDTTDLETLPYDYVDTLSRNLGMTSSTADYQSEYGPRSQVTGATIKRMPWRATVLIDLYYPDDARTFCSGFMISEDTVATAGHCVYEHASGGWATKAIVTPAQDGSTDPFGYCHEVNLISVYGWTHNKKSSYDYGAVKLNCAIGAKTGYFGMLAKPTVENDLARLNGYPAGEPLYKPRGTMWTGRGYLSDHANTRMLYHRIQDAYGDSGGPILEGGGCGGWCAVGIDTFTDTSGGQTRNAATRLTDSVIANYKRWAHPNTYYA